MTNSLCIGLAQFNATVGDVRGNLERLRQWRRDAGQAGCHLLMTPELVLSGYPPEDLVLKRAFLSAIEQAVGELAADTADGGAAVLLGTPWRDRGRLYNAALLVADGVVGAARFKHDLPNYGVFDEKRLFDAGPLPGPIEFRGHRLGAMICEDMWQADVAGHLVRGGAEMLLVLNGSPFDLDKPGERAARAAARVAETGLALAYVNMVGGQDELVFDGASFVMDPSGTIIAGAGAWSEQRLDSQWSGARPMVGAAAKTRVAESREQAIYQAITLGLRDYVAKNGFAGIVLGLSGGIDSALSAAVAVDALGAERVHCLMMPSPYTSDDSLEDARACADLLGVRLDSVAIEPAMAAFEAMLAPLFVGLEPDITEENIQARVRGLVVMGISNKLGPMVLTTGNKSEMSVGYATLYGDMCGGFSVLKDIYKTDVYAVSRWRNENQPAGGLGPGGAVMPGRILSKAPSAELRPDQTDQDSLPPYDVLDAILRALIEDEKGIAETVALGHDEDTVRHIWRMLDRAEYKRRQAPPGVKITSRSFGRDRRYPITNGFTKTV